MVDYTLTDEGEGYLIMKPPEVRLAELLSKQKYKTMSIKEARPHADEFSIALLWAKKNGWVTVEGDRLRLISEYDDTITEKLRAIKHNLEIDPKSLELLISRRLVSEHRMTLEKQAQKLVGKEITTLSKELIATGRWREVKLKPYNVEAASKVIYPGKKHHYTAFLDWVKCKMVALGFEEMRGPVIETEFWNMDALYMPQFHSARDIHGVYQLKDPKYADNMDPAIVNAVKDAHEKGVAGSKGWGYAYDTNHAHRLILRSHDTSISSRTLASNDLKIPGKYFQLVRCFRPDVIDASHLPDFNQLGGFVIEEGMNFRHLVGLLRLFAREFAGTEKIKLVPSYFPFTEPSVEMLAYHGERGWMEIAGAGVFRPEMLKPLGVDVPVIAWGIGVDRLAMIKMGMGDIRDMLSQNIDFIRKKEVVY